jgi:hypothetical protein
MFRTSNGIKNISVGEDAVRCNSAQVCVSHIAGAPLFLAAAMIMAMTGSAEAQVPKSAALQKGGVQQLQIDQLAKTLPPALASAYLVKVKTFSVIGGDKPGDSANLVLTIETSGAGTKDIPWSISDGANVIASGSERGVPAGKTIEVSATYRLPPGAPLVKLQAAIDPKNTLSEPDSERANNLSQVIEKAVRNPLPMPLAPPAPPAPPNAGKPPTTPSAASNAALAAPGKTGRAAEVAVQPAGPDGRANPTAATGLATIAHPTDITRGTTTTTAPSGRPGPAGNVVSGLGSTGVQREQILMPAVKSLTLDANVFRGSSAQGTITLESRALVGGVVKLSSSSDSVGVPQTLMFPIGATSANFTVIAYPGAPAGNVSVTAVGSESGAVAKRASITVWGSEQVDSIAKVDGSCPLQTNHARNPRPGETCRIAVFMETAAGPGGAKANLSSSTAVVTTPVSVSVPANADRSTFDLVVANNATPGPVTISASGDRPGGIPRQLTLTIDPAPPPPPVALSQVDYLFVPSTYYPNQTFEGTIHLDHSAEAGGVNVTLMTPSTYVTVPSSVNIPAGGSTAHFSLRIAAGAPTSNVVISGVRSGSGNTPVTASLRIEENGAASLFQLLFVEPDTLDWIPKPDDSSRSAAPVTALGTVVLSNIAPQGGFLVDIFCTPCGTEETGLSIPSFVRVPAGQTSAQFALTLGTQRPSSKPAGSRVTVHIRGQSGGSGAVNLFTHPTDLFLVWH